MQLLLVLLIHSRIGLFWAMRTLSEYGGIRGDVKAMAEHFHTKRIPIIEHGE